MAYLLLTFNDNFFKASEEDREKWIHFILEEDGKYLLRNPESSLFDFIIARPKKEALNDRVKLEAFQEVENKREERAMKNNGQYYRMSMTQYIDQRLIVKLKRVIKKYLFRRR